MEKISTQISITSLLKLLLVGGIVLSVIVLREILILFFISFILAAASNFGAKVLEETYSVPKKWGISGLFVALGIVLLLVVLLLVPAVVREGILISNTLPEVVRSLEGYFAAVGITVDLGVRSIQDITTIIPSLGQSAFSFVQGIAQAATLGFLAIILGFYIAIDSKGFDSLVLFFVPDHRKAKFQNLLRRSRKVIGEWAVGQFVVALIIVIFMYTVLSIMEVRYAVLLSLLSGLGEFVPFIGPVVSAIMVISLGFAKSPILGVALIIFIIAIQLIKQTLLIPVMSRLQAQLSPLLIIIGLMIGGLLAGPIGVIISTPILSVLALLRKDIEQYLGAGRVSKANKKD